MFLVMCSFGKVASLINSFDFFVIIYLVKIDYKKSKMNLKVCINAKLK